MSRRAVCVASIDMLLGSLTVMPGAHCLMFVQWALRPRKWLVHPESAMAVALWFNMVAASAYRLRIVVLTIELLFKLLGLLVMLL